MDDNEVKRVDVFVPTERMGEFVRKIEHIQATARRLELPEWDVSIGAKEWRPINAFPKDLFPGRLDDAPLQLEGSPVSIVGHAPVLAGWRFLAKIEHGEGGNLVKRMVGGDSSPPAWHTCGPNCEHCNLPRGRNNTYMLQSVESGEIKQVGSSCVSDFLGQAQRDPERIAGMFEYVAELGRDFEYDPDRETGGAIRSRGVDPEILMRAVLKIVQEDGGYLSAEKAEGLNCANTGDRLRDAFWGNKPRVVVPDAGHIERAPQVVAWLKEQKGVDSLWLRNIAYLADRQCITCKDASLFASGFVAWNRELQKVERGTGDWVGAKGDKIVTSATLERHAGFDTAFGFKTVLSFRDEEGNALVWKTQSPPRGLVVGSSYHVLATVKDHGEYAGDKQTEIIRAKIAELELFTFGPLPAYSKFAALASPDVGDESGHSPLLKAVWADEVEHATQLLASGADANQLNQGEIPLLAYAESPKMVRTLLAAGARAVDLTDALLAEMGAEVREMLEAAIQAASAEKVGTTVTQTVDQPERRTSLELRKKVSEMTPDEMRLTLLTSDKTGIGNERSYDESVKKPYQASIDIDSLGWVNDHMGHLGGDKLLLAVGQAFADETSDAYHLHGDEFAAQFESEQIGHEVLARVRERLKATLLSFATPDGAVITKIGIGLSYGIDKTFEGADAKLYTDKAARTAIGERVAKGHEPAGVRREPANGNGADKRDAAGKKITVVDEGLHCGLVLGIENGVVTQKINRAGESVCHDAAKLSVPVKVGDVVEVRYRGGQGEVSGVGQQQAMAVGR